MGHVYRAWDARLHREVAIKLLNHEYAMPGMRERFLREARAASALNHPNICTVFDIGEQDGDPYLVMELLKGETLKDRILNQTMQLDEIVSVARDAAEGLGAAHAKGVIHRDIKPANIFLVDKPNGGSQAKILDFGLAKIDAGALGARSRSLDITTVGATVGTLAYMSPEQARGEQLDSRSDLFSLGVVMYEIATRHVPFQGATSALVFVQLLNHSPEPVREWNESIPRDLEKIIFKLLAKERTARFQTARELELALLALSEKGSGGGWLRKAVATVPLVRAQDPIARERRLSKGKISSDPGLQSSSPRSATPVPPATPEETASTSSSRDQILRPVVRMPRPDPTPNPARNTPAPGDGVAGTFAPFASATTSSSSLPPSQRIAQSRVNASAADTEVPLARMATPIRHSEAEPIILPRPEGSDRTPSRGTQQAFKAAAVGPLNPIDGARWVSEAEATSELDETFPPLITEDRALSRWKSPFQPLRLGLYGIAILLIACLLFTYYNHSHFTPVVLNRGDAVVLAEIENRTGDKKLDLSINEALRIELAQSPYITLLSGNSYRAARRLILIGAPGTGEAPGAIPARKAAERLGAKVYIFGSISGSSAPYTLHIDLRDVGSNDVLATAESHPESLQQVPSAVDQVSADLRAMMGESRASINASNTPLSSEGSSNLAALQLYGEAEALISVRQPIDALADLQQAVTLDPRFIQAQLRLAVLYQQLRAESAAADTARLALAATGAASERTRTLAQAVFEREATGDYPHETVMLRHLVTIYPHDCDALTLLAESLRLQGHMAEALTYAEQATAENPFYAAAYTQAELALIGLDRYDAAYQVDVQAQHLDLARAGESLAAADLDGRQDIVNNLLGNLPVGRLEYRPDWNYGLYLDNAGRFAAGANLWRSRAATAGQNAHLKSAATLLLSQGALDRALLGDCTNALTMLPAVDSQEMFPSGRIALFNTATASALCGDRARATEISAELRQRFPQSFEVKGYFLADIQAAEDLRNHLPVAALNDLISARTYDLLSITPFLRGEAHVAQHEIAVGIVDFQTELAHRGVTYLVGNDVFPAAQLGVARAFADSGDLSNSAEAYQKFLTLWSTADPASPLLNEARTRSNASNSRVH